MTLGFPSPPASMTGTMEVALSHPFILQSFHTSFRKVNKISVAVTGERSLISDSKFSCTEGKRKSERFSILREIVMIINYPDMLGIAFWQSDMPEICSLLIRGFGLRWTEWRSQILNGMQTISDPRVTQKGRKLKVTKPQSRNSDKAKETSRK